jgi:hypothetical protein
MPIAKKLIAPCGMDCAVCMAYLREKNKCPGCLGSNKGKNKSCIRCKIKNCRRLVSSGKKYCFECDMFPCARLKHLDTRYCTKYEMSMIENLEYICKHGIKKFLIREEKRWVKDGKIYCVHHHKYCSQSTGNKKSH